MSIPGQARVLARRILATPLATFPRPWDMGPLMLTIAGGRRTYAMSRGYGGEPPARERLEITNLVQNREAF